MALELTLAEQAREQAEHEFTLAILALRVGDLDDARAHAKAGIGWSWEIR